MSKASLVGATDSYEGVLKFLENIKEDLKMKLKGVKNITQI